MGGTSEPKSSKIILKKALIVKEKVTLFALQRERLPSHRERLSPTIHAKFSPSAIASCITRYVSEC